MPVARHESMQMMRAVRAGILVASWMESVERRLCLFGVALMRRVVPRTTQRCDEADWRCDWMGCSFSGLARHDGRLGLMVDESSA